LLNIVDVRVSPAEKKKELAEDKLRLDSKVTGLAFDKRLMDLFLLYG
jgi:hypothetical protein